MFIFVHVSLPPESLAKVHFHVVILSTHGFAAYPVVAEATKSAGVSRCLDSFAGESAIF